MLGKHIVQTMEGEVESVTPDFEVKYRVGITAYYFRVGDLRLPGQEEKRKFINSLQTGDHISIEVIHELCLVEEED